MIYPNHFYMIDIPRWQGEGIESERHIMSRDSVELLKENLLSGMPIDLGGCFKGRVIEVLCATSTVLIERPNLPGIEVDLYENPSIN